MKHILTVVALLSLPAIGSAQWSKDAALNTRISGGTGQEVQPKVRRGDDGFSFVSWFDSDETGSPQFGYDVRLQRVNPAGTEQWTAGGVLIADRGFSSTQDYGLAAGFSGDAFVTFRDDRFGGTEITATRVDSSGAQVWGANGVQLTSSAGFVAAPVITALPDGGCVVGWIENGTSRFQRLSSTGTSLWGAGVTIPVAAGETAAVNDLHRSNGSSVIYSYISQTGGFTGPRHLRADKLEPNGASAWGGVNVYSAGSLQIANFPIFQTDGDGGAVFSWYNTSLQCFAQRVNGNGTLAFAANGVEVSTNGVRQRVSPHASYRASTGETFVFWTELAAAQSQRGLYGQKFNATGVRQWGNEGIEYVPVSASTDVGFARTALHAATTTVVWFENSGFGTDVVRALNVDAAGALSQPITTIATTTSNKDDLEIAVGPFDDVYAAWHDDRASNPAVYVQNVRESGGVGPAAGALSHTAGTNAQSFTGTVGPLGGTLSLAVDLTTTGHGFAYFSMYVAPDFNPFGTDVILVDLFAPFGNLLNAPVKPGPTATLNRTIPNDPTLCGVVVYMQAWHVDVVLPLRLTNALDIYIGN